MLQNTTSPSHALMLCNFETGCHSQPGHLTAASPPSGLARYSGLWATALATFPLDPARCEPGPPLSGLRPGPRGGCFTCRSGSMQRSQPGHLTKSPPTHHPPPPSAFAGFATTSRLPHTDGPVNARVWSS
eukprot:356365-Chlamydomonas_euryale.AAC.2